MIPVSIIPMLTNRVPCGNCSRGFHCTKGCFWVLYAEVVRVGTFVGKGA